MQPQFTPDAPLAQHDHVSQKEYQYHRCPTSEIVEAIAESEGDITLAAQSLGITRQAVYLRLRGETEIANALVSARAQRGKRKSVKSAWLKGLPKNATDANQRYLYVVQEQWRGWVKIGVANNLYARLSVLRSAMPQEIKLIGYFVLSNAQSLEQHLHGTFQHLRGNGEWFRLSNDDLRELVSIHEGFVREP